MGKTTLHRWVFVILFALSSCESSEKSIDPVSAGVDGTPLSLVDQVLKQYAFPAIGRMNDTLHAASFLLAHGGGLGGQMIDYLYLDALDRLWYLHLGYTLAEPSTEKPAWGQVLREDGSAFAVQITEKRFHPVLPARISTLRSHIYQLLWGPNVPLDHQRCGVMDAQKYDLQAEVRMAGEPRRKTIRFQPCGRFDTKTLAFRLSIHGFCHALADD
jgi:hypothetical protein